MSTAIIKYKDIKGDNEKKNNKKKKSHILRITIPSEPPKRIPYNSKTICFGPDRYRVKRVVVNPRKVKTRIKRIDD